MRLKLASNLETFITRRTAEGNVGERDYIAALGSFEAIYATLFMLASEPRMVEGYNDVLQLGKRMRTNADRWLADAVRQCENTNTELAARAALMDFRFCGAPEPVGPVGHNAKVALTAYQLMHILDMHTAWDLLPKVHETGITYETLREEAAKQGKISPRLSGEAFDYLNLAASKNTAVAYVPNEDYSSVSLLWQDMARELSKRFTEPLGVNGHKFLKIRTVAQFVGVNP
jgi:hypothetical protein